MTDKVDMADVVLITEIMSAAQALPVTTRKLHGSALPIELFAPITATFSPVGEDQYRSFADCFEKSFVQEPNNAPREIVLRFFKHFGSDLGKQCCIDYIARNFPEALIDAPFEAAKFMRPEYIQRADAIRFALAYKKEFNTIYTPIASITHATKGVTP